MKIRNGFVSNSSSSSFVILKDQLTKTQISMIKNHITVSQALDDNWNFYDFTDSWSIEENEHYISGDCVMNNFPMDMYLDDIINIDLDYVHWISEIGLTYNQIRKKDKLTTVRKRKEKLDVIENKLRDEN